MTTFLNIFPGADSPQGTILAIIGALYCRTTCSFGGTLWDGRTE